MRTLIKLTLAFCLLIATSCAKPACGFTDRGAIKKINTANNKLLTYKSIS